MRLRFLYVWFQCAVVILCVLISGHPVHTFSECIWPYTCYIHNIRCTCVRDIYYSGRIFAIRIHLCTCLRKLKHVCANEQKPAATPVRYLSQISPFCLWLPANVYWTRLTMHCRKAGVTCHWRKKTTKTFKEDLCLWSTLRVWAEIINLCRLSKTRPHVYVMHVI